MYVVLLPCCSSYISHARRLCVDLFWYSYGKQTFLKWNVLKPIRNQSLDRLNYQKLLQPPSKANGAS